MGEASWHCRNGAGFNHPSDKGPYPPGCGRMHGICQRQSIVGAWPQRESQHSSLHALGQIRSVFIPAGLRDMEEAAGQGGVVPVGPWLEWLFESSPHPGSQHSVPVAWVLRRVLFRWSWVRGGSSRGQSSVRQGPGGGRQARRQAPSCWELPP